MNLPVKDVDEVAALDFASDMLTLLPATAIVASTRSLSDVTELVTVAWAVVPAAAHTVVTSSICTFPSLLSIVINVLAPLYAVLSNCVIDELAVKDVNCPPSTLQSSSSTKSPVESKTVRYDVVPPFQPLLIFHAHSEPFASKDMNALESNLVTKSC